MEPTAVLTAAGTQKDGLPPVGIIILMSHLWAAANGTTVPWGPTAKPRAPPWIQPPYSQQSPPKGTDYRVWASTHPQVQITRRPFRPGQVWVFESLLGKENDRTAKLFVHEKNCCWCMKRTLVIATKSLLAGHTHIARYNARLMHAYCTLQCTLHCTLRNPYAKLSFWTLVTLK